MFPSVAGEDEDDVKSIRYHRIKMETSGNSLEESMEEGRVEEMSISKVRQSTGLFIYLLRKKDCLYRKSLEKNLINPFKFQAYYY